MLLDADKAKAVTVRTGAEIIDRKSAVQKKLEFVFGEHTFFRSSAGLFIVEPTSDPKRPNRTLVKRVRLARWTDKAHKVLKPIEDTPKAREIAI